MYGQFCPNQNFLDTKITKVSSMVLRCKKVWYATRQPRYLLFSFTDKTGKSTSNTSLHTMRISNSSRTGDSRVFTSRVVISRLSPPKGVSLQRAFPARLEKSFCTYLLCSIMAIATFSLSLDMARSSTFWLYLFNRISCSFTDSRYDTRDAWPVVAAKFRAVF